MSNLVTPIGNVQYAYVKNEEIIHHSDGRATPTGKYSITVGFTDEQSQKFSEAIDKVWAEFLEKEGSGKEFHLAKYVTPVREFDGKKFFVFRKNVSAISRETNQPVKLYVPLFDSENKNCTKNVASIGRNSQVKISYSYYPFYMSGTNYGVSLRLNAIQLIKLVPITSNGGKYGFEAVDGGYVAQALDDSEIPF